MKIENKAIFLVLIGIGQLVSHNDAKVIQIKLNKRSFSGEEELKKARSLLSGSKKIVNIPVNDYLYMYQADISLGTPAQLFTALLDTERADFWIASTSCKTSYCNLRFLYDSKNSTTYTPKTTRTYAVTYRDGTSISGKAATDILVLGSLTISKQDFIMASSTRKLTEEAFDGVIGLAYSNKTNQKDFLNPIENAFNSRLITDKVFALQITSNGGNLTIGGVDNTVFKGSIKYIRVKQNGIWGFQTTRVFIGNNKKSRNLHAKGIEARIDSKLSVIAVPSTIFTTIATYLNAKFTKAKNAYTVDCNLLKDGTSIKFVAGGKTFNLAADTFIYLEYSFTGKDTCYLTLASTNQNYWILGSPFLSSFYTVYNATNNRIGIADYVKIKKPIS